MKKPLIYLLMVACPWCALGVEKRPAEKERYSLEYHYAVKAEILRVQHTLPFGWPEGHILRDLESCKEEWKKGREKAAAELGRATNQLSRLRGEWLLMEIQLRELQFEERRVGGYLSYTSTNALPHLRGQWIREELLSYTNKWNAEDLQWIHDKMKVSEERKTKIARFEAEKARLNREIKAIEQPDSTPPPAPPGDIAPISPFTLPKPDK